MTTQYLLRPLGLLASIALTCAALGAATVTLPVEADATIDQALPNVNLGTNDKVNAQDGNDGGPRPIQKGYLRFDASKLPPITDISGFTVFYTEKRSRSGGYFLIEGEGANNWGETTITWNNAPANRPDINAEAFVAGSGQTVTGLGSHTGEPFAAGEVVFGKPGASAAEAKQALIKALNTGDRKATIGIIHDGTRFYSIGSKEGKNPSATLTLVTED